MKNDLWADDLDLDISRALADDLAALLPGYEIVTLPSRLGLTIDYEVRVELTRFEIAADGDTSMAGRWSIVDKTDGTARTIGRIAREERARTPGIASAVAAISHNLQAASREIAAAVTNLPAGGPPRP